jgi:protein phosphatase
MLEDHEILEVVSSMPPAQAVGKLVDLANARGGHDNITVVVLRAREAAIAPAGGLAPTVAQTSFTQAPATVVDTSPPVAEEHVGRKTEPLIVAPVVIPPAPVVIPAAPEDLPPPSSHVVDPRRGANPAVVVGVVLAVLAMVLLGIVLLSHLRERGGKPSEKGSLAMPVFDAAPATTATLAPSSVEVPTTTASEPIAPLVPSPSKAKPSSR